MDSIAPPLAERSPVDDPQRPQQMLTNVGLITAPANGWLNGQWNGQWNGLLAAWLGLISTKLLH